MSYLNTLRFHFAGKFFAAPSTINNSPENYTEALKANFDRNVFWQIGDEGSWNPEGASRFRFRNVAVTSGFYSDGTAVPAAGDSLLSLRVESRDRVSAKLVDLDPDQQLVSMIYGLTLAITDAQGHVLIEGKMEPAPFSDIWSRGRNGPNDIAGDERASAFYQSILTVSTWGDLSGSRFLQQLRQAASDNVLSIKFNVDGYSMLSGGPGRIHTGRIVGAVAAATPSAPRHWVPARQLASGTYRFDRPQEMASPGFRPRENFGVAIVDEARGKVRVDLGNALTVDLNAGLPPNSPVTNIGRLSLVFLQPNNSESPIAEINYTTQDWYEKTAGIVELPPDRTLTAAELQSIRSHPLCIVADTPAQGGQPAQHRRILTEPATHIRADLFVARLNPGDQAGIDFHASRLGQPVAGAQITLQHLVPASLNAVFPFAGLTFPASTVTDAQGNARVTLTAHDPGANRFHLSGPAPRTDVDGQVYRLSYRLNGVLPGNTSDFLSVLVWNEFRADNPPTWHGSLRPVFTQFGNLYPYMTTQGNGVGAEPWLDLVFCRTNN